MKVTFLGQQSWIISEKDTHILVDPVLTRTFGTSPELQFLVYPARTINVDKMPFISAVFITNEHLDHFHLLSLKQINKEINIYVGTAMPDCVKQQIIRMGFSLIELANEEFVSIGYIKARFYIGRKEVPFWEKRVYQLYLTSKESSQGVFIQSDTLINDRFIELVEKDIEPCPTVFIATNNSQLVDQDRIGAFDNMLPLDDSDTQGLKGLQALEEVLVQYPSKLPRVSHLFLSGSGYIIDKPEAKPFQFSDAKTLENNLNALSLGLPVHVLNPGEEVNILDSQVERNCVLWITPDIPEKYEDKTKNDDLTNLKNPLFKDLNEDYKKFLPLVEDELKTLAKLLMLSTLGKNLLSVNEYLNGALGPERFVIHFRLSSKQSLFYVLNLNKASFVLIETSKKDVLYKYPFGIEVFIGDFIGLLLGRIQIWELATANMRQWYLGDKLSFPVASLYWCFSEQVRQDLATKVYENLNAR